MSAEKLFKRQNTNFYLVKIPKIQMRSGGIFLQYIFCKEASTVLYNYLEDSTFLAGQSLEISSRIPQCVEQGNLKGGNSICQIVYSAILKKQVTS